MYVDLGSGSGQGFLGGQIRGAEKDEFGRTQEGGRMSSKYPRRHCRQAQGRGRGGGDAERKNAEPSRNSAQK